MEEQKETDCEIDNNAQGTSVGKRDFGSFHCSNVEELINMPDDEYTPPELPFTLPSYEEYRQSAGTKPAFGSHTKSKHYFIERDCTFLNHGAFGASLREACMVAQQWQAYSERQPLRFYDREVMPHLVHVTRRMAKFVGCAPCELALVSNATTAITAIIKSLDIKPGDNLYLFNVTYGPVKKLLKQTAMEKGATTQEETIEFPLQSKQEIIDLLSTTLKEGTRLAVFDHIPSSTAFILPIKEMIDICRQRGVTVLIDGAHSLGMLPLHLDKLGADYYITNCHKWFSSHKGCALMYVRKDRQSTVAPLVISHGYGHGFNSDFMWTGLKDYSPFLSLHTVLDFWQNVGVQRIRDYIYRLRQEAGDYLVKRWDSGLLAPHEMLGGMALIRLPNPMQKTGAAYSDAETIQNALYNQFNIEVPIKAVQGQLYVRISCHIHNELKEYRNLADAILTLAHEDGS